MNFLNVDRATSSANFIRRITAGNSFSIVDHNLRSWVSRPFVWTRQSSRASGLHPVFYGAAAFHAHATSHSTRRSTRGRRSERRNTTRRLYAVGLRRRCCSCQLKSAHGCWRRWHSRSAMGGMAMCWAWASAGQQQHTSGSPSPAPPSTQRIKGNPSVLRCCIIGAKKMLNLQ